MKSLRSKGKQSTLPIRGALLPAPFSRWRDIVRRPRTNREAASRFFRDSPTPDEKAAIADSSDVDFDAGIGGADLKKKRRRPPSAHRLRILT
jgi:hypothetical protein